MRIAFSIIFSVLIVALGVCAFFAFKSKKQMGKTVAFLVLSLIPPVFGNLCIISSPVEILSWTGCYIYFIGLDLVIGSLLYFTGKYCGTIQKHRVVRYVFYAILTADAIQLLLNIWTHHAFGIELVEYQGADFYHLIPFVGQVIHRVVDYGILGAIIVYFLIKTIITPKIYSERYLVILIAMVATTIWETFYIFSEAPIDRSMIGFGAFGIVVFILSLYYRPLRLLDRLLGVIASEMPEALLFFDNSRRCIWVNQQAEKVLGVKSDNLDYAYNLLIQRLGDFDEEGLQWSKEINIGSNDSFESFFIEKHPIMDRRNKKVIGYFFSIRDNTSEKKDLQRETYNASHDVLTGVYNRAGYNSIIENIDLQKCFLLLIDLDSFKETNDQFGHEMGDKVLVKITETIQKNFRDDDYICRIGGDEFAIIIHNIDDDTVKSLSKRVNDINKELKANKETLHTTTISAGGAYGKDAEDAYELFNNADHAMYQTKFGGKSGFTLFKKR